MEVFLYFSTKMEVDYGSPILIYTQAMSTLQRIVLASARKLYRIGLLFTRKTLISWRFL